MNVYIWQIQEGDERATLEYLGPNTFDNWFKYCHNCGQLFWFQGRDDQNARWFGGIVEDGNLCLNCEHFAGILERDGTKNLQMQIFNMQLWRLRKQIIEEVREEFRNEIEALRSELEMRMKDVDYP